MSALGFGPEEDPINFDLAHRRTLDATLEPKHNDTPAQPRTLFRFINQERRRMLMFLPPSFPLSGYTKYRTPPVSLFPDGLLRCLIDQLVRTNAADDVSPLLRVEGGLGQVVNNSYKKKKTYSRRSASPAAAPA